MKSLSAEQGMGPLLGWNRKAPTVTACSVPTWACICLLGGGGRYSEVKGGKVFICG